MASVLIVDDSAMDRRLAGGLLEKRTNWSIDYAVDGQDALVKLHETLPDLVLTDLQMPNLDGLELVRHVKEHHPLLPVILMTAAGSEEIAVKALEQGAASYVPKRELAHDLVDIMERVLAVAGERRAETDLLRSLQDMKSSFSLPNDTAVLVSLVGYLQRLINEMQLFQEAERLRIGVALEEALLNAAYHGNLEVSSKLREEDHASYYRLARERMELEPYRDRTIQVEVEIDRNGISYTIRDEGLGFDPSSLPDPTDPANLDRPCGRGLLLMRTFMDTVEYNDTGNQVVMTKHVGNGQAAAAG